MTIINIRGTNGSGKTTLVRGLMAAAVGEVEKVGARVAKPTGYRFNLKDKHGVVLPTFVLGSYENINGGCDTIKTQDEACDLVRRYAPDHNVVFEGVLISVLYDRYRKLDKELTTQGHTFIWGFMDTPVQTCIDRVLARRVARGADIKDFDPNNSITPKHKQCINVRAKAKGTGSAIVKDIPHQNAVAEVLTWL